jgi:hypothetical protein
MQLELSPRSGALLIIQRLCFSSRHNFGLLAEPRLVLPLPLVIEAIELRVAEVEETFIRSAAEGAVVVAVLPEIWPEEVVEQERAA